MALFIDDRTLNGIGIWVKPLKFELSLALNMLTILLLLVAAAPNLRENDLVRRCALVIAAASTFEIAYIAMQAARGVGSHFNVATPLARIGYGLMGVGAVAMVAAAFVIGWAMLRERPLAGREGLRLGAATGLMLGAVLTLITAGVLSTGVDGPGHWVGGDRTDATGLFLTGWSTTGGDLRVPHFFATHLTQAIPLAGLIADRAGVRRPGLWVAAVAAAGTVVVALTFLQALLGRPFMT